MSLATRVLSCATALMAYSAILWPISGLRAQNPPRVDIVRFYGAIAVDGDLADWGTQAVPLQIPEGDEKPAGWQGPKDLSARIRMAYGTNHLYLAGEVLSANRELPE